MIRAAEVGLCWGLNNGERKPLMPINAVLVRESGRSKDDRIEWLLLTAARIAPSSTEGRRPIIAHSYAKYRRRGSPLFHRERCP